MQHRVPSPREIVMHAQSIMQSALIKKKLEEQRENFRKRQDQQQQQQQQQQQVQQRASSPVNSPAKQTMSPTPLAFTPTSVLRKMTADKEPEGANRSNHQLESKYLLLSTTNENRNNIYRNTFNFKRNTFTQQSASCDNAIELINYSKHGSISGKDTWLSLPVKLPKNDNNNGDIEESALKDNHNSFVVASMSYAQQKKDNAIELTNHKKHGNMSGTDARLLLPIKLSQNDNNNSDVEESALENNHNSFVETCMSYMQQKDWQNDLILKLKRTERTIEKNKLTCEKLSNENINKELNLSDSNNNSPLILDKLSSEQFEIETVIVDNKKALEKIEENKIAVLQSDEVVI